MICKEHAAFIANEEMLRRLQERPIYGDIVSVLPKRKVYLYLFIVVSTQARNGESNPLRRQVKKLLLPRRWQSPFPVYNNKPKIAVRIVEGVNLQRRSDFVWFPNSGIDPSQVLVYIDQNNIFYKKSLAKEIGDVFNKNINYVPGHVLKQLQEWGLKWVFMNRGISLNNIAARRTPEWLIKIKKRCTSSLDRWLVEEVETLWQEVCFWQRFYQAFNIKIDFMTEEGSPVSIAKGIAFDLLRKSQGITAGKQRSDVASSPNVTTGFYTKDVFFTWNRRAEILLKPEYNKVKVQVITGHPNDINFYRKNEKLEKIKQGLNEYGANFIIALFDSGYSFPKKREFLLLFYKVFLTLVIRNPTVGLVIKSKKPYIIQGLTEIHELLREAETTGRCYRFKDMEGRLPSDASQIADIAVGAGLLNSGITEAIIAGCRGCYCSYEFPKEYPYYKLGYGKFIFDDPVKLGKEIEVFMAKPETMPDLGNMTPFLNELDPYRDEKASERMGTYLCWILKSFDKGKNRDEAIEYANERYSRTWGKDKVINL